MLIENSDGAVLLLKRDKEPFAGFWHIPGGFLLKDEPIKECIDRLAKEEVGVRVSGYDFLGYHENIGGDPRKVHIVHLIFKCKVDTLVPETESTKFWNKLPENIISYHKDFLNKFGYK